MSTLTGVHVIMPTPFKADGELDLPSLERLTEFLVGLGVDGLVVLGVLGESPKLSQEEQEKVVIATVAVAGGRVPVFAASGAAGTHLAIERSIRALDLGASGLLVAPPPVQNDSVIFEYYRQIDEAVDRPIILHDYPTATGISMSPELVVKLHAELAHVEVIKLEDTPSAPKVSAIRKLGSDMTILGGLGGLYMLEELERGSNGIMTGFSFPDTLLSIYRAFTDGDVDRARSLFYGACPLMRFEFQPGIGLAIRKEVYRRRGAIQTGVLRHPGTQTDDVLEAELERVLEFSGLGVQGEVKS